MHLRAGVIALSVLLLQQLAPSGPAAAPPPFDEWLNGVRAEALTRGIKEATLDRALSGLEPLPVVVQRDRTQAELVLTLDRYLRQHLTKRVIDTAAAKRRAHAAVLKKVEQQYGVPPEVVVAIWGMESNF